LPRVKAAEDRLPDVLAAAWATFAKAYPTIEPGLPVYAGPGFFAPPVQLRSIRGRPSLVVAVDTLGANEARLPDPTALLHREMFRAWHAQINPGARIDPPAPPNAAKAAGPPLYVRLWSDGLALFAARRLDPEVPLEVLLESTTLATTAKPI